MNCRFIDWSSCSSFLSSSVFLLFWEIFNCSHAGGRDILSAGRVGSSSLALGQEWLLPPIVVVDQLIASRPVSGVGCWVVSSKYPRAAGTMYVHMWCWLRWFVSSGLLVAEQTPHAILGIRPSGPVVWSHIITSGCRSIIWCEIISSVRWCGREVAVSHMCVRVRTC